MSEAIFFLGYSICFLAIVLLVVRRIDLEIDFGRKTTTPDPESETPSDTETK